MKKLSALITLLALGLASTSFAQDLTLISSNMGPDPKTMRCSGVKVNEVTCHKLRVRALESGCINEGHFQSLVKYDSFPLCIDFNQQRRFMAWCPCDPQQANN